MNDNRDSRLPVGLIWLLIYQWILVLVAVALGCSMASILVSGPKWEIPDVLLGGFELLVLACWGTAMGVASVGMVRRSPRGFLLGMICHGLLEIPGLPIMVGFGGMALLSLSGGGEGGGMEPLFLLFALMWLPFVLISAWAFFYLRRLRMQLFS
jgi:hypothetical protein